MKQAEHTNMSPTTSYSKSSGTIFANNIGGLAMRTTPDMRLAPAQIRNKPQYSLRMQMEKIMTRTGDENRIVVESPRGSRVKEVKINKSLRPPVTTTRNKNIKVFFFASPTKECFL